MIPKGIEKIEESDLQDLVDHSVLENRTIEYKKILPGGTDEDKKEFLADISSFANAQGGDVIYGIIANEKTSVPQKLEGIEIENVDREITKLDSSIRDGISPRIIGIRIQPVKLSNFKIAIVIRIPKSWNLPHRITYKGHDKFYSRSTNGKYPLDVNELRIAFNQSTAIAEKIRNFRMERISKILAGDTNVPLLDNPKILLHIIPLVAFNLGQQYNLEIIVKNNHTLIPLHTDSCGHRYNLDGILVSTPEVNGRYSSYVQIFKNGIIESVESSMLAKYDNQSSIPSSLFGEELRKGVSRYKSVLKESGVELPAYLFLSLLNVKNYYMVTGNYRQDNYFRKTIDRDHLLIPEVVIESYDSREEDIIRPCLDSVWNACGFPKSWNYDENNNWRG